MKKWKSGNQNKFFVTSSHILHVVHETYYFLHYFPARLKISHNSSVMFANPLIEFPPRWIVASMIPLNRKNTHPLSGFRTGFFTRFLTNFPVSFNRCLSVHCAIEWMNRHSTIIIANASILLSFQILLWNMKTPIFQKTKPALNPTPTHVTGPDSHQPWGIDHWLPEQISPVFHVLV